LYCLHGRSFHRNAETWFVAARDGVPDGRASARKYMRTGAANGTEEQAPAPRRQKVESEARAICGGARSYRGLRKAKV
jgi:hypothetical protein